VTYSITNQTSFECFLFYRNQQIKFKKNRLQTTEYQQYQMHSEK